MERWLPAVVPPSEQQRSPQGHYYARWVTETDSSKQSILRTAIDQLSVPIEAALDGGLWAADGSGVIVGRSTATANRTIVWQPLGEGPAVDLLTGSIGTRQR